MPDINPEIVCQVIEHAREFHALDALSFGASPESPEDVGALQALSGFESDQTFANAKAVIDDLEPDQQATVVALMWVGRGDFDAEDFESALQAAQDGWTPRTADYLLATPLVADYLADALDQLGYSCE